MQIINIVLILLAAVSVGLSLFILARIKHVVYLLEQPVVKKMGPELKLKTVKVDEADHSQRHGNRQGQPGQNQGRPQSGPRPTEQNGGNRERGPRPEGQPPREGSQNRSDRPERSGSDHRGPDRDRGPRHDRGDRDRGPRNDRGDRGDRPERQRPRLEVFNSEGTAPAAPVDQAPRSEAAPAPANNQERPALSPRRPLPASVDREESAPIAAAHTESAQDGVFVGDDSDMQHGRRTQVKKKPRFEINEEELKSEEIKVQA